MTSWRCCRSLLTAASTLALLGPGVASSMPIEAGDNPGPRLAYESATVLDLQATLEHVLRRLRVVEAQIEALEAESRETAACAAPLPDQGSKGVAPAEPLAKPAEVEPPLGWEPVGSERRAAGEEPVRPAEPLSP